MDVTDAITQIDGLSDNMIMLRLLEAHRLPVLSYGIEVIHVINRDDRRQMRVAWPTTQFTGNSLDIPTAKV